MTEQNLSATEKHFLYEALGGECCPVCGIESFTHFHFEGDLPKEFYKATEVKEGYIKDIDDGIFFKNGRVFQLKKARQW